MQRHWEGAFVVRDVMDKRFRELSSVAMLARRDIDRHIWLSECRPDLASLAPAPPGLVETKALRKKKTRKRCADVANASSRRTHYSCRAIDDMAHSSGSELSDLLRFFSTLDMDLQKVLLEAITRHKSSKTTKKKDSAIQKDERISNQETYLPRLLKRGSRCAVLSPGEEDESPCSFREWTHFSSKQRNCGRENAKCSTEEISSSRGERASSSSCRLTNSSGRPRGGCGNVDTEDEGVCRDAAIQTRGTLRKASKMNHKAQDQSWEGAKLLDTAGRMLVDDSTSSRGERRGEDHLEEAVEKQLEDTTINVLERWAEPLEQYLSSLQKFEQQLREKWLNPEEIETASNSGAQSGDLESPCTRLMSDTPSEAQMQTTLPSGVKTQLDEPFSNKKFGSSDMISRPDAGGHPLLDNVIQENCTNHESGFKAPKSPEVRNSDENFHRARAAASESLHGKAKPEYLAAGFRNRKLVEWWSRDKQCRPHTTKPRCGSNIFSVYDPRMLLGEKPSVKPWKEKPEWWPALRRPYSASEIEAMRQKEDTAKATRRKSPSKIFSGYRAQRPLGNKSQRKKTRDMETSGNQRSPQCMAQRDDDSPKRAIRMEATPLRLSPRKNDQKVKERGQKLEGFANAHKQCQNLRTASDFEPLNVKNIHERKTGHAGLHALQEHNQFGRQGISDTAEDQVCGVISHVDDQVCGILTQLQQMESPREGTTQARAQSQADLENELPTAPAVDVHSEQHQVELKGNKRNQSNSFVQRGIERLADKLIDQAVNEVASELAEFCETVADQMYTAEFVT